MASETFVVGIAGAGIQSGVIYIDLASLSLTERDQQGKPGREVRHRLLLTPEGAVELHRAAQSALDRLVELGVLTKGDTQQAPPAAGQTGQGPPGEGGPQSPNFS